MTLFQVLNGSLFSAKRVIIAKWVIIDPVYEAVMAVSSNNAPFSLFSFNSRAVLILPVAGFWQGAG